MRKTRIVCGACHGGSIAQEYGVRMSDGTSGSATVIGDCPHCKGTGWITHPGTFKPVSGHGRGNDYKEAWAEE